MRKKTSSFDSKVEFIVKKSSQTGISQAELVGTDLLRLTWTTTTFKATYCKHALDGKPCTRLVSKKPVGKVSKNQEFKLVEISREGLLEIRKSGVAGFVLKLGDKLYYTELTPKTNLFSVDVCGNHKCCCEQKLCKHLSATTDEEGGCAKVRDRSCGIERYDFITKGCETFGTQHDMFVVASCVNYEDCPPRKKVPVLKKREMRLELARFMWEDVETFEQVQERKTRNYERNAQEATARAAKVKKNNNDKVASKNGKSRKLAVAAKTAK